MEAAIRWSPHSTQQTPRFLLIDVAGNRLRLCQIESIDKNNVKYKQLCQRDKLPNFTAFDWSKRDEHFVGIGSASGEATVVQIDADRPQSDFIHSFPIKHQRKCNSIAFSLKNYVATGLDRVRNDFCMNIYDLNIPSLSTVQEPYRKLASSEAITSIKFYSGQPDTLIAGVSRQCVRLYDLRDSGGAGVAQYPTRQVHNIAIDPLDENYFVSAGPTGDPTVSVWDRRFAARSNPGTPGDASHATAVLEIRPVVDNSQSATIWSLRYSGTKRACFGVLSNTGEVKVIELAQHLHKSEQHQNSTSPHAIAWSSPHYNKVSHNLRYPWYDERHGGDENSRVIACDFMAAGNPSSGQCVLALHPSREVEVLKVPNPAPRINVTALEEIYKNRVLVARPSPKQGTVSEDLIELQNRVLGEKHSINSVPKDSLSGRLDKLTIDHPRRKASTVTIPSAAHSSRDMHEDILTMAYPDAKLGLSDTLKVLETQKRRCQEGYNLDCRKNKEVVANDPWLVELWSLITRLDVLAYEGGMIDEGLDLSYLGVVSIWANKLGSNERRLVGAETPSKSTFVDAIKAICRKKEFPTFQGIQTTFPEHRQLCLAMCGWNLSKKGLRERCMALMDQGEHHKAIVLAVFKGYKDVALDLLRYAVQQKLLQNIGLGAVIACDYVSEEQRHMCSWMAEETDDPYLKALLAYFISGDWNSVTEMTQLSLTDRVGVAIKYLDDERLSSFLKFAQTEAIVYGNIEGVLLTGLAEKAMDLFEHYIAKFGDIQTAVLAMARTNPLYINDHRWAYWKDIYLAQMQTWRAFLERTHFIKEHNVRSVTRNQQSLNKPSSPALSIRCHNCQMNLALRRNLKNKREYLATDPQQPMPPHKRFLGRQSSGNGLSCPNCGAQMPRCGLCMMWLGSPDPAKPGSAAALAEEDLEARLMVFCMKCTHGFHGNHARDWFARHAMCPVPDCQCMCGLMK
ncbi:hypothetical protein K432DRAFT_329449 [Lepidopterella palustris CBS 459.81]|uniref:Uncharacterized protein n=1 Tax=Lepidopterella palustris CBS 459.81 TaxID=1314670 RepID=A0A8E2E9M1_9PEZI|nr:hypothetical protein K432DRAFT_329449 [Lepidopterella palustris CBS 459.81]